MTRHSLDIAAVNQLDRTAFARLLGGIFENSPWVAEAVWEQRPFASLANLHEAMTAHVRGLSRERRLALLCAHPELAGREVPLGRITSDSRAEQSSAGLDRLSEADAARFDSLNAAYRAKFGFPFIIAVRDHTPASILARFEERLANPPEQEIENALSQVLRITWLRLERAFSAAG